ncbi:hypothetical protein BKA70DRAFT_181118 [Coprinopsis sp. MPI-PUGE-AT-0042]|nr:hypothetical protein BKA70DRAFT_181118 [Coprinopsis sp. MPI-PUGE-AT-0042]
MAALAPLSRHPLCSPRRTSVLSWSMAQHPTHNAETDFYAGSTRRQYGVAMYSAPRLRATIVPNARDLQIVDSTLSVIGGDVVYNHNHHYQHERPKDIWAILQAIPNFRNIYHDMLSKATPGTGMWLVKGKKFRLWLEPNGDIKIFWGSGIPGAGKTLLA